MQISATLESVLAGIFTLFVTEPKGNCHINDAQSTGLETDLNQQGLFVMLQPFVIIGRGCLLILTEKIYFSSRFTFNTHLWSTTAF